MRILLMADVPPDPNAGASGTELRTIEALRAQGHEVDAIWAGDLGRRIAHGNLHYLVELPRAYRRALSAALTQKRYDVVHVNQPHGWLAAKWLRDISDRPQFVHRSHGLEPHVDEVVSEWRERLGHERAASPHRRLMRAAMQRLLDRHVRAIARYADGHIVSASLDRDYLTAHYGVAAERIAVIPQAAPDEFLTADAPPMTSERYRRVLHVAQTAFFKAPMITAAAINRLAADPDRTFTWVSDRSSHASIRAMLTAEAGARTELLHWMPQDALRDVYDAHGVFLFPSFFEGFGKAFLEAMSRGLCVIASDAGGMHDVITHGVDGVLVPPGDAEAIADAVRALTPERAASMSVAAAQTARRYTWDRVARETAAFYRRLMEAKR